MLALQTWPHATQEALCPRPTPMAPVASPVLGAPFPLPTLAVSASSWLVWSTSPLWTSSWAWLALGLGQPLEEQFPHIPCGKN
jgi:hypothetical protein